MGGRTTVTVVTEIKCLSRAEMRLHIKGLLYSSFLAVSKRWREEKSYILNVTLLGFVIFAKWNILSDLVFSWQKSSHLQRTMCACEFFCSFSFFGCFNCCCNLHILQIFQS